MMRSWQLTVCCIAAATALAGSRAYAHCDTLDGPVVKAAQAALTQHNVNLVLIWVKSDYEATIREAFAKTEAVRKLDSQAKDLADMYFFETLVRLHRAGEGAPYTGLKPTGTAAEPAVLCADKAIETGAKDRLMAILTDAVQKGVAAHFHAVLAKKNYDANNVQAGRQYVEAYVEYVHYIERLYEDATGPAHGHFPDQPDSGHAADSTDID